MNYLMSAQFVFDFMALLGNNLFQTIFPKIKFLALFKVARVTRLGTYIAHSNFPKHIKAPLRLLKYTLYFVIYLNFVGCSWWIVCSLHKNDFRNGQSLKWYSPTDWINYADSTLFEPSTTKMD